MTRPGGTVSRSAHPVNSHNSELTQCLLGLSVLLEKPSRPAPRQVDILMETDHHGVLGAKQPLVETVRSGPAMPKQDNLVRGSRTQAGRGEQVRLQGGLVGHARHKRKRRFRLRFRAPIPSSISFPVPGLMTEWRAPNDVLISAQIALRALGMESEIAEERLGSGQQVSRAWDVDGTDQDRREAAVEQELNNRRVCKEADMRRIQQAGAGVLKVAFAERGEH